MRFPASSSGKGELKERILYQLDYNEKIITKDVAIFCNSGLIDSSQDIQRDLPPINEELRIAEDLIIDVLPRADIEKVMSACEPRGYNFDPVRQLDERINEEFPIS
ncbi:MAG: hypothetical protein ACYDH0_00320 [Candidatus Aminicenantales bacterium]